MIINWAATQTFAHNASSSLASVGMRKRRFTGGHSVRDQKKPLQYSPWDGSFFFWYKKHLLTFRSVKTVERYFSKEEIAISCIGRSSQILKDLLNKCRCEYLELMKNKTSIFKHRHDDWEKTEAVDIRQPETVILDEEKKTALLDDIKCFLESKAWYSALGTPHRRGYLLYGPPGTGKSSLSLLIAGACDLDIYILTLSSLNDDSLDELFTKLPPRCIVLLEDIDAVDAAHSRQHGAEPTVQEAKSSLRENRKGKVSLSALLNAIDGVGSQEGRLLIMTTNHVEQLDAALIRPGRVDMKLELGLTNYDMSAQLFCTIFGSNISDNEVTEGNMKTGKAKELEGEKKTKLKELAAEFAREVPENEFSPAEVKLYLMSYRKSPMAVKNAEEWVVRLREEKRPKGADLRILEGLRKGSDGTPPDNSTMPVASLDGAQDRGMESAIAQVETPIPATDFHCCSCQVLNNIMVICRAEEMPSVNSPYF